MIENPFEILNEIRKEQEQLRILLERLLNPDSSNSNSDDPLLTQKEAYQWARTTEATWIRWRNKGKIPFKHIGGRYLYSKKDLLAAISKMKGGMQ